MKDDELKTEETLLNVCRQLQDSYLEDGITNDPENVDLPSTDEIITGVKKILNLLFPGFSQKTQFSGKHASLWASSLLKDIYLDLRQMIKKSIAFGNQKLCDDNCCLAAEKITLDIIKQFSTIRKKLIKDSHAAYAGDPAAMSIEEIILCYPGFIAVAYYRIAHEFYVREIPYLARIIGEYAHSKTGCDIHPGAKIGKEFFVDHATGVVIGETSIIGDRVKIYQHVTLGALSFSKDEDGNLIRGQKRHPTIEDDVVIYSGSTILGGKTVIGKNSVIGGNVWITESLPPDTVIIYDLKNTEYKIFSKTA